MANWYCTREQLKRFGGVNGADEDAQVDHIIEARSREIDRATRRFFIPRTETRLFRWPPRQTSRATVLWLDQDLISVTTLQTKAQDSSPTTIAAADFFLEPNNLGPPFNRIEIDLSSTAAFESGDTPQRSISVLGSWGFSNDTKSAGTVASGLASSSSAVSMVSSDSSLIGVGNTLLIESEQIFVSAKAFAALDSILIDGALTKSKSEVSVTVDTGHGIADGEIIMVDSEQMLVESSTATVLTVTRAYNGSVLAAHSNDTAVQIARTLTIERGINGTTAVTHSNATVIYVYEPPFDIVDLCIAESLAFHAQHGAKWGRTVGPGEGGFEFKTRALGDIRNKVIAQYKKLREAAI